MKGIRSKRVQPDEDMYASSDEEENLGQGEISVLSLKDKLTSINNMVYKFDTFSGYEENKDEGKINKIEDEMQKKRKENQKALESLLIENKSQIESQKNLETVNENSWKQSFYFENELERKSKNFEQKLKKEQIEYVDNIYCLKRKSGFYIDVLEKSLSKIKNNLLPACERLKMQIAEFESQRIQQEYLYEEIFSNEDNNPNINLLNVKNSSKKAMETINILITELYNEKKIRNQYMQLYHEKTTTQEFVPLNEIITNYNRIILKMLLNNFAISDFELQKQIIAFLNKNITHSVLKHFDNAKFIDNLSNFKSRGKKFSRLEKNDINIFFNQPLAQKGNKKNKADNVLSDFYENYIKEESYNLSISQPKDTPEIDEQILTNTAVTKKASEDFNKLPKPSKYIKTIKVNVEPNLEKKEVKKQVNKSHKIKKYEIVFDKNIVRKINVESFYLVYYQIIYLLLILVPCALLHALWNL